MTVRGNERDERIGGKTVHFTNLDKVLWSKDGYTKGDLIGYYRAVARWLVPYLKDRPLTLQRYPNGIDKGSFFEKNAPKGLPDWVPTALERSPESERGHIRYVVCNDEATLAYLANLAAITLHAWISRTQSADSPDFLLFDLDPWTGCSLQTLARVALAVRDSLEGLRLKPAVKTTGGDGLHVMLRLRPGHSYASVRDFCELVARAIAAEQPNDVTLERMTAKRKRGRVYIDWVQIGRGKTIVPPFVVRARPGAPVSMPIPWKIVEGWAKNSGVKAERALHRWTIENVPALLRAGGDPWRAMMRSQQSLASAVNRAKRVRK